MPEFQIVSGGSVERIAPIAGDKISPGLGQVHGWWIYDDLDAFTAGYVEALFFTETELGTTTATHNPETQSSLPGDYGFADLAPKSLQRIIVDCQVFQSVAAPLLAAAYATGDYNATQAGRDFWFTRNGHGVGYWDRSALEPLDASKVLEAPRYGDPEWSAWQREREEKSLGKRLSAAAKAMGESWVTLGDDRRVHVQ